MANDKVLPEGIRIFPKQDRAPEFVKGTVMITLEDLWKFTKEHPEYLGDYQGKKQLKLQLLESKEGKLYMTVDQYGTPSQPAAPAQQSRGSARQTAHIPDNDPNSLPF